MTLYNEDCLEVLPEIPDKSVDLIFTDLPYGTTNNKWDSIIPLDDLWIQYNRIIKDNGVIVLFSHGVFTAELIMSNKKDFKYKIIWVKSKSTNFLNAKKQPLRKYEELCVFYKNKPTYNPQFREGKAYNKGFRKNSRTGSYNKFGSVEVKSNGSRYPTDVLYYKTAETEGKVYHSTQKPVSLCKYIIKTYTNENDLVLDTCMGSGSIGVACKELNRDFIGIELDYDFYNLSKKRLGD